MLLSKRSLLGIAAIIDIALHAPFGAVAAKTLAIRHNLPSRHLETMLQAFVKAGILKGVRGPRGGYELAKERRRIHVGDIIRAALDEDAALPHNALIECVIQPRLHSAETKFLAQLDLMNLEDMCKEAQIKGIFVDAKNKTPDFTI